MNKKKVKLNEQQEEHTIITPIDPLLPCVEIALNPSMNLEKLYSTQVLALVEIYKSFYALGHSAVPIVGDGSRSHQSNVVFLKRNQLLRNVFAHCTLSKNKSSLKTIVLLSVSRLDASEFEGFINENKETYLAKYVNKHCYTRFKSGPFMMHVIVFSQ